MGGTASGENDEGDENNAHKILLIRTKDSGGHLFIGANVEGGYWHVKKYVSFSDSDAPNAANITIALSLWDTPPLDYTANVHDHLTAPYYPLAHGLFCVYNVESTQSFNLICHKISHFYRNPQITPFKDESKVVIMLIGHKTKGFNESQRRVPQQTAIKFATALDITFLEVCSRNVEDMSDLYTIMGKNMYQLYGELPLRNKQNMTQMFDTMKTKHSDASDDEKVINDQIDSESDSISDLSDAGTHKQKQKHEFDKLQQSRHRSSAEDRASIERRHKESIECNPVSERFKQFIEERVQIPYLFELFAEKRSDDIRMIEFFDENMLQNEIGIKNIIHRKLLLKECQAFKFEIDQFRRWLLDRLQLRRYLNNFESNALMTMTHITQEIYSQSDIEIKLQITNKKHQNILWQEIQTYECAINDAEYNLNPKEFVHTKREDKKPAVVLTKMTNAYANIQRNKQIFNQITKTNKFKQETTKKMAILNTTKHAKSTRDIEHMITKIDLNAIPQRRWQTQRSSSLSSTKSLTGAPLTPKPQRNTKRRVKKRRKSFSLGMQ